MPDENAAVLEFAAILGEAIARAHLAGIDSEEMPKQSCPTKLTEAGKGEATQRAAIVDGLING